MELNEYVVKSGVVIPACNPSMWASQGDDSPDLKPSLGYLVNIGPFEAAQPDCLQKQCYTCYTNNNNNNKRSRDLTQFLTFFLLTSQSELETLPRTKEMGHNILVYLLTYATIFQQS